MDPPQEQNPASPEDKKDNPEHINIKVVDHNNNEVFFKIKRSTPFNKLMNAYAARQGKTLDSLRFLYDGERISPNDTPHALEMDDEDTIDVMIEQVGGAALF